MSELRTRKITPIDGETDVTLGDSGDTFTIPAGATIINSGTATGFASSGTVGGTMSSSIIPDTNEAYDLGSASFKIRDAYISDNTIYMGDEATIKSEGTAIVVQDLKTGDLHLDNTQRAGNSVDGTNGSWTFQEGAEDMYLLNNVTGKKYKINLTEI